MSSMCKSSNTMGCGEEFVPTRATYDNLYRRPESDAEFVKSVVGKKKGDNVSAPTTATLNKRKWIPEGPEVVDSYSCRRMFLKSYTFTKKESLFDKTMKRLGKLKESRPSFVKRKARKNDGKKNRTEEVCLDAREELTRVYHVVVRSVLRRLLSCTATIDVVDHPHRTFDADG